MMNIQTKQQGFVLVIGLLMLVVITIVGVTAMSSTSSNERMTANSQFQTISFQAAESAIHDQYNLNGVTPTVPAYPNDVTTTNNYDVDLNSVAGSTIGVVAQADVQFCGELVGEESEYPNGIEPGHMEFLFDVHGTGQVGIGTQDQHQQRGGLLLPSVSTSFDPVVCIPIQ